jgi:DNA-binding transcriptional ArsR family regulator
MLVMGTDATRHADAIVGALQVLGDPTRLKILLLLGGGELNVSQLQERLASKQPTVSHQLGLLRAWRLVVHRREGKRVFYRLSPTVTAAGPGALRVATAGGVVSIANC